MVLSATVLPPALGPVMMSVVVWLSMASSSGTTFLWRASLGLRAVLSRKIPSSESVGMLQANVLPNLARAMW